MLQKLQKEDLNRFSDYLLSPYFNKKKVLCNFWDALKKYAPDFIFDEKQKKQVFTAAFHKTFNDAYYRNICSDMLSAVLHFLTIKSFEKNNQLVSETGVDMLIEKELYELADKQLKLAQKNSEKTTGRYIDRLKNRIWFNDKETTLKIRKSRNKQEEIATYMYENTGYKKIMDYMLVKCFLQFLNKQKAASSSGIQSITREAEKILAIYENGLHSGDLFVKYYYLVTKIRLLKDDSRYPELKKLLMKNEAGLVSEDLENIVIAMLSCLSEKVESGDSYWYNEMLEVYDFRLKNKLWNLNGNLSYVALFNIVFIALQLNKIQYAEYVVEKYPLYVAANIRKNITDLCLAYIHFYKNDIAAAHKYLVKIETENIMIKYELRTLQSMIYFEQKEYLVLLSYLDSFKHFISYNIDSLEEIISNNRIKFCAYLSQLVKVKTDPDKKNEKKLKAEIEADQFLLKDWLLEKL
ncbi:MAG: hypothetical protein ACKVPJ_13795 [Chitinophagales bacterium]